MSPVLKHETPLIHHILGMLQNDSRGWPVILKNFHEHFTCCLEATRPLRHTPHLGYANVAGVPLPAAKAPHPRRNANGCVRVVVAALPRTNHLLLHAILAP